MLEVAVTMARLVVKAAGEADEFLIGRCIVICVALFKEHPLMVALTGDLRVEFGCDSVCQNRGERKVSFAEAFRTHSRTFQI